MAKFILITICSIHLWACNAQVKNVTVDNVAQIIDSICLAAEKEGFHGVVLYEAEGKIALSKGYGIANHASNKKFTTGTYVQIGSNVKDFTKTAIYQLVEQGKLQANDQLGKFIPGLKGSKATITVQDLLTHKSGFPLGIKEDDEPFTTAEMLQSIDTLNLISAPGSSRNYSNLGYSCLAYIVAQVSGMPYDRYVYENVLKPIGLKETGSYIPRFNENNIAHGYEDGKDIGIILDMPHDDEGHLWSLRGNGGYLSTVGEMNTFYSSFNDTVLLKNPRHRGLVFNPEASNVLAGSDRVSFFLVSSMPEQKAKLILASNHNQYMGNRVMKQIELMLEGGSKGRKMMRQMDNEEDDNGDVKILTPFINKLPVTGAGLTISRYLQAYNTGDKKMMETFFNKYGKASTTPMEKKMTMYENIYGDLGKLQFINYYLTPKGDYVVNAKGEKAESDAKIILQFMLEEQAPWRFIGLSINIERD